MKKTANKITNLPPNVLRLMARHMNTISQTMLASSSQALRNPLALIALKARNAHLPANIILAHIRSLITRAARSDWKKTYLQTNQTKASTRVSAFAFATIQSDLERLWHPTNNVPQHAYVLTITKNATQKIKQQLGYNVMLGMNLYNEHTVRIFDINFQLQVSVDPKGFVRLKALHPPDRRTEEGRAFYEEVMEAVREYNKDPIHSAPKNRNRGRPANASR